MPNGYYDQGADGSEPLPITRSILVGARPSIAMVLKYIGAQVYADVEVVAGGDMTLSHGATVGAKVGDSTTGIDSSGTTPNGTAGAFDLSTPNAACDTYGELADLINASTNWRCELVDATRSMLTNNTLDTQAVLEVTNTNNGVPLYLDPAVVQLTSTYALTASITPGYLYNDFDRLEELKHNPAQSRVRTRRSEITKVTAKITAAAGDGTNTTFRVYEIKEDGTVTEVWRKAGPATTVEESYEFPSVLISKNGSKFVIGIFTTAAAITAGYLTVEGASRASGVKAGTFERDSLTTIY